MVLKKENDHLKKLSQVEDRQIKLQDMQIKLYEKQLEACKQLNANFENSEETMNKLTNAYERRVQELEQQLQVLAGYNIELLEKLEAMQAIIDKRATE